MHINSHTQILESISSQKLLQNSIRPEIDTTVNVTDWSPLRNSISLEYRKYSLSNAEAYCSDSGAVIGKCSTLLTDCDGKLKPYSMCQCNEGSGNIEKCSKFAVLFDELICAFIRWLIPAITVQLNLSPRWFLFSAYTGETRI